MKSLEEKKWKEFLFPEIFIIKNGFYNKKPVEDTDANIPFLGATESNNGITSFHRIEDIEKTSKMGYGKNDELDKKIFPGNCIAVTNNGSVGHAYYQENEFTCSHDINPLYLKNYKLNKSIAMFLISAIEMQGVCFEYARKWRPIRMRKSKIILPIDDYGNPDYIYMERYALEIEKNKKNKYIDYIKESIKGIEYKKIENVEEKEWKEVFIEELADIDSGHDIYEQERIDGKMPYATATSVNNGIGYYVNNFNNTLEKDCLSVNRNGSVGCAFYHPYPTLFSNDCRKLRLKRKSKYIALFVANQISQQKEKYNYGYKMGTGRLRRQKILLPVQDNGLIDYDYMEQYIKNIIFKKLNHYLNKMEKNYSN